MRNNVLAQVAAVLMVVLGAVPIPASATSTGMALGMCIARGPDCSITNKGDNYLLCVNNTDGQQCVSCPNLAQPSDKQTCTVARTSMGGRRAHVGVASLLAEEYTASPSKDDHVPKQTAKP